MMNARLLAGLLFVLTFAGPASALDFEKEVIEKWNHRMVETANLLKAQDHRAALRLANKTVSEMVEMLGPGNAATAAFGLALVHKALAHAGLGQHDDARWYWQTTVSLYPQLANDDLSMFGAAGRFLKDNTTHQAEPSSVKVGGSGKPVAPRILKRVDARYPRGASAFKVGGQLAVEVVITTEGKVRSPRIVTPLPAPTLSYAALEAVKQWRFHPGTLGGQPIPTVFKLTMTFNPG